MPQQPIKLTPVDDSPPINLIPVDSGDPVGDAKNTLSNVSDPFADIISAHENNPPQGSGFLDKIKHAWNWASTPLTDLPNRIAEHANENAHSSIPIVDKVLGINRGLNNVTGSILTGMTSPINAAMLATGVGEVGAAKVGLSGLAKALSVGSKALSIPNIIEGGSDIYNKPTVMGKLGGLAEVGMGVLPFMHGSGKVDFNDPNIKPNIKPTINEPIKPTKPINLTPVDTSTGEILDKELTPPNESGIPQFGGKGKLTGSQQINTKPNTITLKAGEGLDKVQEITKGGYKLDGQNPDGSYSFTKTPDAPLTENQVANSPNAQIGPKIDTSKKHIISEVLSMPRSIMASTDMSAPLRQGLPLIHKKEYWQAIPDLFKSFFSEDAFQTVQKSIMDKPLFKPRIINNEVQPSFANEAGLKLTDLHNLSNREEMLQSSLAEKVPLFGKLYRASERSYISFLNKLRADTFENLVNSKQIFNPDKTTDMAGVKALADFVNTATGRGSLDFSVKLGGKTVIPANLERSSENLGNLFFAPRLMASRMRMLNPAYYIFAPKIVRMERLKSLMAVAGAGNAVGQLGKMMGGDVEDNPNSSDYGKIKFGNTHLDPWAGFQQYVVAANRLLRPELVKIDSMKDNETGIVPIDLASGMLGNPGGHMKSTLTGHDYALDSSPVGSTKWDVATRFARYKLNPAIGSALNMWLGKDANGQPTNYPEEIISKFTPLFLQDLKTLATENPNLLPNFDGMYDKFGGDSYSEFHPENLPFAAPAWFGMGVQNYKPKQ